MRNKSFQRIAEGVRLQAHLRPSPLGVGENLQKNLLAVKKETS